MFKIILVPLLALVTGAAAFDYRYLVHKPKCTNMTDFEVTWKGYCPYFAPALAAGYSDGYAFFERGNYQGEHKDTQALVYCTFKSMNPGPGVPAVQYTTQLFQTLGAYQLTPD